METFGIPYGRAVLRNGREGVECPVCGQFCFDVDESQRTAEDAVTKGSAYAYAVHYEAEHAK